MTQHTKYTIRSISDLLDIPPDRLDDCLRELTAGVKLVHLADTLAKTEGIKNALEGTRKLWDADGIVWCDDQDKTIHVEMTGQSSFTNH